MKEGLFFYGVHVPGDNLVIDQGEQTTAPVFSYTANSLFSIQDKTMMTTEKTADPLLVLFFIKIGFLHDDCLS